MTDATVDSLLTMMHQLADQPAVCLLACHRMADGCCFVEEMYPHVMHVWPQHVYYLL